MPSLCTLIRCFFHRTRKYNFFGLISFHLIAQFDAIFPFQKKFFFPFHVAASWRELFAFHCSGCLLLLRYEMIDDHDDNWWRMIMMWMKLLGESSARGGWSSVSHTFHVLFSRRWWKSGASFFFRVKSSFVRRRKVFLARRKDTRKFWWIKKNHFSFLKKEKSVDFKPVESSSRIADLRMQLWPSKKHACKTANSAVLDIQAPIRGVDWWARSSCGDERRRKKKKSWNKITKITTL